MKILTFGGVYVTIKSPNMRLPADLRADAGIGTGDSHKSNKLDYSYSDKIHYRVSSHFSAHTKIADKMLQHDLEWVGGESRYWQGYLSDQHIDGNWKPHTWLYPSAPEIACRSTDRIWGDWGRRE